MAAVAIAAVSLYPPSVGGITLKTRNEWYPAGRDQKSIVTKRVKITAVTAADTITPTVLGLKTIMEVTSAVYFSTTMKTLPVVVDPTLNSDTGGIVVGAGPSAETIYLVVTGEK